MSLELEEGDSEPARARRLSRFHLPPPGPPLLLPKSENFQWESASIDYRGRTVQFTRKEDNIFTWHLHLLIRQVREQKKQIL